MEAVNRAYKLHKTISSKTSEFPLLRPSSLQQPCHLHPKPQLFQHLINCQKKDQQQYARPLLSFYPESLSNLTAIGGPYHARC